MSERHDAGAAVNPTWPTDEDVRALIERLEKATEGSRELDAEVWWLAENNHAQTAYWNAATGLPRKITGPMPAGLGRVGVQCSAPAYTTDINAAMALVPDHIECGEIKFSRNKTGRQYCHVTLEQSAESLGRDMRDDEPLEIEAQNAATPALALVIASLKARASGGGR